MDKYQYQPNAAAQALSRQESDAVGLLLPEVNNPFFSEMISGISAFIEKSGLRWCSAIRITIRFLGCRGAGNDESAAGEGTHLCSGLRLRRRGKLWPDQKSAGTPERPIVILDRPIAKLTYDCVTTDNFSGAMECTNALIEAGHRRIGVVVGNMELFIGRERFRGFKKALESARIPLKEKDVLYGEFSQQTTYQLVKEMLESGDYPRAFFLSIT